MLDKDVIFIDNKSTFGKRVPSEKQMEVDLEDALDIAGSGRYQIQHLALMAWVLAAALLEIIDSSFVLPAAACDLAVKESLKGLIACLPNIGIVLTATLWGRAADSWGRKPVLIISTAAAGFFGAVAAFMPNLTGYAISKFAMSLFLSPPSSLSFAYCGELMTRRRRDLAMLMLSCLLNISSTLTPLLSWAILPFTWHYDMGIITFRPWRLLTLVNAIPLLISALMLTRSLESPKFLVTKGRYEEALDNLRYIYVKNNGASVAFPVESLKKSNHGNNIVSNGVSDEDLHCKSEQENTSAVDLLKPPHLKWLALTGFLMFSVFSLLNGLFLFAPDTVNKLMSRTDFNGTICDILNQNDTQPNNETIFEPACNDTITTDTFKIMVITTFIYSIIVLVISLTPIPKKFLLVITFSSVGVASLLSGLVKIRLLAAMAMSGLQVTSLGVGPLTAYAVELFPTTLRGTAVGILMMFGRIGSITGANVAGVCLAAACQATFFTWAALMFACAVLSLALPKTSSRIAVAMSISSTSS